MSMVSLRLLSFYPLSLVCKLGSFCVVKKVEKMNLFSFGVLVLTFSISKILFPPLWQNSKGDPFNVSFSISK